MTTANWEEQQTNKTMGQLQLLICKKKKKKQRKKQRKKKVKGIM